MALIKCNHCGKQISDKATSCPKCGTPRTPVNFHPMHEVGKSNEKSNQHLSIQKTHENFDTQVSRDNPSKKTLYLPIITLGAIAIGVIVWLAVTFLRTPKGLNDNELNELQELKSRTMQIQERNAELQALRQDSIRRVNEKKQKVMDQMISILKNTKIRYKNEIESEWEGFEFIKDSRYFTTDYNKDDIPELWIFGPIGIIAECSPLEIFVMNSNGVVTKIKDLCLDGEFKIKDGVIYGVGHEGTDYDAGWFVSKMSIKGNKLIETIVDMGEYYEESRYSKYDNYPEPEKSSLSDYSLLRKSFKLDNSQTN